MEASVNYFITAPVHYECVANGKLENVTKLNAQQRKYTFRSDIALPTKVMVFGLADFESKTIENDSEIELKAWVYPQDAADGFHDMEVAKDPLAFYIERIGPYPFEKLHNVQSTTRFGGMENAGCIFYDEGAITGNGTMENLIAHEIAHQWFGNSVTESDWPHLWLSEGFATYFTNLHLEKKYGRSKMNEQLIKDRTRIINFSKNAQLPVIDTVSSDLMQLLNPNAYEKGSWFLHMLRIKVGEEAFWKGIQLYYDRFKFKNATSDDFRDIMSKTSGQDHTEFFDQWLRNSGHPQLKVTRGKNNRFAIEQVQEGILFKFPLELKVNYSNGQSTTLNVEITSNEFSYKSNDKRTIQSIELDPNTNLLFEVVK
jgi:aminopeptidase N